ncbi:hypothetical protein IW152_000373 [Coemansia sp. BCRC 34962]|nr:hypothetical protein IW152_000373 [Coemansia sp. BCRC 34962]
MGSNDTWEDFLFSPPQWPYEDGDPAAPAAHPTIHQYGYDIRQLDKLPVQAGYSQRAGAPTGMTPERARQYYSQFLVFRRTMLDPQWATRQQREPVGEHVGGKSGWRRRLSRSHGQSRGRSRRMSLSSERWSRRRMSHTSTDSARTRVSRSPTISTPSSGSDSENEPTAVKRKSESASGTSLGKTFAVLRVPLVVAILAAIIIELVFYCIIRQIVRLYEACVIWQGRRGLLFNGLSNARNYEEYMEFARAIDSEMGFGSDGFSHFDAHVLVRITRAMRRARVRAEEQSGSSSDTNNDDHPGVAVQRRAVLRLCDVLRQGAVRANAGGWESREVWSRAYAKGNRMVDEYVAEAERSLWCVRRSSAISAAEKLAIFEDLGQQQGRTALCLSGGAAMGWKHLGVARCLLEEARMPRVICGTSAGALVAALLATHTDDELRRIVRPELAKYMTACQRPLRDGLKKWLDEGHFFDAVEWAARAQVFTRGDLTFKEAFARTGKILNIPCTPMGGHRNSAPRLLNYVTAPNVLVWSAVLASAGLPGILPPMVLLQKSRNGRARPYTDLGVLWRDGSFCSDIPYGPDLRLLNVQFTVVSQVNPHITMFFYDRGGSVGQPPARGRRSMWRGGFILSAIEHMLKLDIRKWLRLLCDLNLVPLLFNQDWSYVWLQKFDGNVTVLPQGSVGEWMGLLQDPSEESLERSMRLGTVATWPKIKMIGTRQRVEDAVAEGWADAYRACYGASPPPTTLALRGKQGCRRKKSIAEVYHCHRRVDQDVDRVVVAQSEQG